MGHSGSFRYRSAVLVDGPITPALASPRRRFGLLPFRSPLQGESLLLSLPAGTKMFQFPAFASPGPGDVRIASDGLPHSDIHGSRDICSSPWLFAACHVLPRLREPRHPPCALSSFRFIFKNRSSYKSELASGFYLTSRESTPARRSL